MSEDEEYVKAAMAAGLAKGLHEDISGTQAGIDQIQQLLSWSSAYLLIEDEQMLQYVGRLAKESQGELSQLVPLFSRLVRLTNIPRQQARIDQLDVEIMLGVMEMFMPEDRFESNTYLKMQALRYFLQNTIYDSVDGWKLNKMTQPVKRIELSTERRKRGWFR